MLGIEAIVTRCCDYAPCETPFKTETAEFPSLLIYRINLIGYWDAYIATIDKSEKYNNDENIRKHIETQNIAILKFYTIYAEHNVTYYF